MHIVDSKCSPLIDQNERVSGVSLRLQSDWHTNDITAPGMPEDAETELRHVQCFQSCAFDLWSWFFFPLRQCRGGGGEQVGRGGEQADRAGYGDPVHVASGGEGQWNRWEFGVLTNSGLARCVNPEDWPTAVLCRWGGASDRPAAEGTWGQAQRGSKKPLHSTAKTTKGWPSVNSFSPFLDVEPDERAGWALW